MSKSILLSSLLCIAVLELLKHLHFNHCPKYVLVILRVGFNTRYLW